MEYELIQDQKWWRRNRSNRLFANQPVKRRIFDHIKRKGADGATTREILDVVYQHDPNGGPESNCISAHVRQMNKVLRDLGMQIINTMGQAATYHLENVNT